MQNIGFIKIHRKIRDNPIFWKPNYLAVFMCIILDVEFQETTRVLRGDIINLRPGEGLFFQKEIADKFNISIGTVSNILKKMNSENIIEIRTTSKYSIIGLVNWDAYQVQTENTYENELKTSGNRTENELKHLKNTKEDSKKTQEEKYIIEKEILKFWNEKKIIEHRESQAIFDGISKALKKFSLDDIKKGIGIYSDVQKSEETFFDYEWTLLEFLSRKNGLANFILKTKENFMRKKPITKGTGKPFVDYDAEKKKTLEREKKADQDKIDAQAKIDSDKRKMQNARNWFNSLPEESGLKQKIQNEIDSNKTIQMGFSSVEKQPEGSLMREEKLRIANLQKENIGNVIICQFFS